ncbi:MAG: PTS sugar transporter subunit IIA [Candidatus Eisenbacteria bacterium]|nr:PTS sugar transporter subunit IIA [Candidatus Eisenbacteria bacterium]MCC7141366.1 PTS sugar transporter subunit IIA [Candidatus Eisenbacteria bacterium]
MDLARLLRPELILLELETKELPESELGETPLERYQWELKEQILGELVDLVDRSGRVGNKGKLLQDLVNREKKATTGLAHGVAIPHVRTMHARDFLIGFARSTPGVNFDCFDGEPAHLFFIMVAPPYNDVSYLRIYKSLAEAFSFRDARREFMEAQDEGEVLRAVKRMSQG